jgi:hypothetical protein
MERTVQALGDNPQRMCRDKREKLGARMEEFR